MSFTLALLVSSGSSITVMTALAAQFKQRGNQPQMIFDSSDDIAFDRLKTIAQRDDLPVHRLDMSDVDLTSRTPFLPKLLTKLWNKVIARTLYRLRTPPVIDYHFENNRIHLHRAHTLLKKLNIRLLIVGEDGVSGNCWLIGAARQMDIPVLDCPYEFSTYTDFETSLGIKAAMNNIVIPDAQERAKIEAIAPQWIKRGKYEGATMFPAPLILAREALGLTLRNAWVTHGGFADHLAAESKSTYDCYLAEEACPPDKPVLTGSVYGDVVSKGMDEDPSYRVAFNTTNRIKPGRTSILLSWPTNYHDERGHFCEFPDYETLTRKVIGYITSLPNVDLTLSLHPNTPPRFRQIVASIHPITTKDVLTLIPQNDIFITCGSSTMRWAVACAKPVIDYEFYNFELPEYKVCPAVFRVNDFQSFQDRLHSLVTDESAYQSAAQAQKKLAPEWGILDGQNFNRIYELALAMLNKPRLTKETEANQ